MSENENDTAQPEITTTATLPVEIPSVVNAFGYRWEFGPASLFANRGRQSAIRRVAKYMLSIAPGEVEARAEIVDPYYIDIIAALRTIKAVNVDLPMDGPALIESFRVDIGAWCDWVVANRVLEDDASAALFQSLLASAREPNKTLWYPEPALPPAKTNVDAKDPNTDEPKTVNVGDATETISQATAYVNGNPDATLPDTQTLELAAEALGVANEQQADEKNLEAATIY